MWEVVHLDYGASSLTAELIVSTSFKRGKRYQLQYKCYSSSQLLRAICPTFLRQLYRAEMENFFVRCPNPSHVRRKPSVNGNPQHAKSLGDSEWVLLGSIAPLPAGINGKSDRLR
jgi:hypothetical protein